MNQVRISVITPCYNMEKYIEKTILSVIGQNYENLQYIIVDGGSTDETLNIADRYKDKISVIISEPDKGMYDAIHKGFLLADGDIIAWLNADDQYFPWTFNTVSQIFSENKHLDWITGQNAYADTNGNLVKIYTHPGSKPSSYINKGWFRQEIFGYLQQESMFWRRDLYFKSGGLDLNYRYAGDFDLWRRMANYAELFTVSVPLAMFMIRNDSLSNAGKNKYEDEVRKSCSNNKAYPGFWWRFSLNKLALTHLLRQMTICKSGICYYSSKKKRFITAYTKRKVSNNSLSELYYEFLLK